MSEETCSVRTDAPTKEEVLAAWEVYAEKSREAQRAGMEFLKLKDLYDWNEIYEAEDAKK